MYILKAVKIAINSSHLCIVCSHVYNEKTLWNCCINLCMHTKIQQFIIESVAHIIVKETKFIVWILLSAKKSIRIVANIFTEM